MGLHPQRLSHSNPDYNIVHTYTLCQQQFAETEKRSQQFVQKFARNKKEGILFVTQFKPEMSP